MIPNPIQNNFLLFQSFLFKKPERNIRLCISLCSWKCFFVATLILTSMVLINKKLFFRNNYHIMSRRMHFVFNRFEIFLIVQFVNSLCLNRHVRWEKYISVGAPSSIFISTSNQFYNNYKFLVYCRLSIVIFLNLNPSPTVHMVAHSVVKCYHTYY